MRFNILILKYLIFVGGFFVYQSSAWALTTIKRDFNELLQLSDIVLVGTVSEQKSRWRDPVAQDFIETVITFNELEVLKGVVTETHYDVVTAGGSMPPFIQRIVGSPHFELKRRYVLFIKDNRKVLFPFVGVHDGIFLIDESGEQRLVKTLSGQVVTAIKGDRVIKEQSSAKALSDSALSESAFLNIITQRLRDMRAVKAEAAEAQ